MTAEGGQAPVKARVRQQLRGLLQILADEPDGMHYVALMRRLREVLPPTEYELSTNASGAMRFDTNAGWWSVDLVKAGWLVKDKGVWRITDEGREALIAYPDSWEFGEVANQAYKAWKAQDTAEKATKEDWALADQILARVPVGRWISAGDLGRVAGYAPTSVGIHVWKDVPPRWHVVLRQTGEVPADVYEDVDRSQEQHALLESEGIVAEPFAPADLRLSLAELEGLAADLVASRRAWQVRGTSAKVSSMVQQLVSDDLVSIPASRLPKLPQAPDDEAIKTAVAIGYDSIGYSQREAKTEEIRTFVRRIRPGDLVLTTADEDVFVGRVTSAFEQVDSPGLRSNLRHEVDWQNADNPLDLGQLPSRLEGRMRSGSDVIDLGEVYDDVAALLDLDLDVDEVTEAPELIPDLPTEVVDRLLLDPAWLSEFVELLRAKKQVIVYGPPGTGKTFVAQEVAEALAGKGHVTLVQFHPSYSYEDFFEGYRPAPAAAGGVGPLRKVVDLARANPTQPYVLIIDEINRANLAKVFGELYFLLEYRDRTIDLLYSSGVSGPAFSLPENVYVIGTMNTADRSIALVDAAMRRRFAFLSLHPADQRLDLVLRSWLADRGLPEDRADLLVELNRRIADKDIKIGPSYLMSPAAGDDAGLGRIWRTAILPLLEEYHVGDGVDVRARYGLPALRKALQSVEPGSPE